MKKNNTLMKMSLTITLYLLLAFFLSSLIVVGVISIFNFIGKPYVKNNFTLFIIICFLVDLVLGTIISYFILRKISRQTKIISNVLNKLSDGDFTTKLPNDIGFALTKEFVDDFNQMVDRLNETAILQTSFASNFSHEFKTPIFLIKGYAELIKENKNLTEQEREKYLDVIINESKRLSALSTSTLLISKLDATTRLEKRSPIRIDSQIEETILLFDNQLQEKNIEIEINLEPCTVLGDTDVLKEVWINLISNAVKYNKNDGKIIVSLTLSQDKCMLSISDTGIGMSAKVCSHAFDKFYQGDPSRLANGNGLGLSIVKKIVSLHGGDVTVTSVFDKGSTFTVILPIYKR